MRTGKIKALIVDDEEPARSLVKAYLKEEDNIEIIAECANGFEAIKAIQEHNPGIIFLDIQMPKITGFELLEVIDPGPEIIFTTAYDEYALKAFELNAVDYLLKPFTRDRFRQAVNRAMTRIRSEEGKTQGNVRELHEVLKAGQGEMERIVVRSGSKLIVIPVDKVIYIEAEGDYVKVCTETGNHLKDSTMKFMEENLPPDIFIRIHRSYIANIEFISSLEQYSKDSHLAIMKNGDRIKVSQEGYKKIRKLL